jgi:hypothetical protein
MTARLRAQRPLHIWLSRYIELKNNSKSGLGQYVSFTMMGMWKGIM